MFGYEVCYLFFGKLGEYLYISLCIVVGGIEPELVKFVWRGVLCRQSNIVRLCFAELGAVGFGYKRTSEGKSLALLYTTNKFGTGGYITPLV